MDDSEVDVIEGKSDEDGDPGLDKVKNDSKVDIIIPYLNDKKGYNFGNVKIYSQNIKLIFRGNMKNGRIEDAIYVPSGS